LAHGEPLLAVTDAILLKISIVLYRLDLKNIDIFKNNTIKQHIKGLVIVSQRCSTYAHLYRVIVGNTVLHEFL